MVMTVGSWPAAARTGANTPEPNLLTAADVFGTLHGLPLSVQMTRVSDMYLRLEERAAFAKQHAADLYVSLHGNANVNAEYHGAEIFHWPGNKIGEEVARAIAVTMPLAVRRRTMSATVRPASSQWGRVRNIIGPPPCTAVLVEYGFISNTRDAAYLATHWGRAQIACSVSAGICRFGELVG
jgi:N-acetylmuramoyl-L-alanine amidase